MARVYVIRHGQPAAPYGGHDPDPGLSETGLQQARAAARALLAMPEPPTRIVSSPLLRCRETAQSFADALGAPMEIDERVAEIPTPTYLPYEERQAWLARGLKGSWAEVEGDHDYDAWRWRVVRAAAEHSGAAVFSHAIALNAMVGTAQRARQAIVFLPDHCSISVFEPGGDGLILIEKGREVATEFL